MSGPRWRFVLVVTLLLATADQSAVEVRTDNPRGHQVAGLFEGPATGARQSVTWDATGNPSGLYLVRVRSGERVEFKKIALLK